MIKKLSALSAIVLVIAAASCKKSNNDTPSLNVQGQWTIYQDWDWSTYTSTGAYEDGGRFNGNPLVLITINANQFITFDGSSTGQQSDTATYKTIGNSYVVLNGNDSLQVLHYNADTLVLRNVSLSTDNSGNSITEIDTLGLARKQ